MNGRDENGRFVPGNKAAAKENGGNGGRLSREVEARYLDVVRKTVKLEDLEAITLTAIAKAKNGDLGARAWISDWTLGKPVQRIAPTDPTGEREYRGLDYSKLTDEELAALDAIAQRIVGPEEGTPAA